MEPQVTPVPQAPPPIPEAPQNPKSNVNLLAVVTLVLLILVIVIGYFIYKNYFAKTQSIFSYKDCVNAKGSFIQESFPPVCVTKSGQRFVQQTVSSPTPTPIAKNEVLGIQINTCCSCPTKVPRSLIGTDGWVIYERGKNYSKYLPEECNRADCQPCPPLEEENQNKIDCKNPRPEVCTMECIENPPYICGSDGKSYCSVCQVCSDKNIAWYEMKTSACTKEEIK